jgi:exopolyphosphatase/guanosine-5'-triphosphate,3'-diphosphate pyrophosphatase
MSALAAPFKLAPALSSESRDAAVIDVGSNSVRLVIYRLEGRAIWTVFNEKVLAGLGSDLSSTGRLSPQGRKAALAALRRFSAMLGAINPAEIFTAATAAIRDATDGEDFVRQALAETGLSLRVLSGVEEAHYAALGVLAGAPAATGVVGDLGGASLELTRLDVHGPGVGVTLPLGPFAMRGKESEIRKAVAATIGAVAPHFKADAFHAVGGAWRNLALLHMRMADYPLHVVHQYEMGRREALDAARVIARLPKGSLEGIPGISKKRAETLPHAAVVMEQLIEQLNLQRICLSAYGLREGLLFEAMPPGLRLRDPLLEGCAALAARTGGDDGLGEGLEAWLEPVFGTLKPVFSERDATLRGAACRMADLGARLHPDHRADLAFEQVLRAPIGGQTHAERAFLAVAAFARHSSGSSFPEPVTVARLLSSDRLRRARALGAGVRLGCDLSGRSATLLAHARLQARDGRLVLSTEAGWGDMLLGEQTEKRAQTLAGLLGLTLELKRS